MEHLMAIYGSLDQWMRESILMISMAQVATLLVIFGDHINTVVRLVVRPYPFLLRITAFVALCAFGYGTITAITTPLYADMLATMNQWMLTPFLLVTFIFIGVLAERGISSRRRRPA
jgi:hypothetical protein